MYHADETKLHLFTVLESYSILSSPFIDIDIFEVLQFIDYESVSICLFYCKVL